MTHSEQIPELDRNGLRRFGLLTGAVFALIFGVLFPWLGDRGLILWPWLVSAALWLWALAAPATLQSFYRAWMRVGMAIGRFNTRILLGIVFFLIIMPIGVVMKLFRRDPLARAFDGALTSYRVPSESPPKDRMEKPF